MDPRTDEGDEMSATATRTTFRTCPLCEAGCGLEIGLAGENGDTRVARIRGDREDVFSHGFICPKGSTLKQLQEDPDWLRRPLVKRDGTFVEVGWDEAFAEVERRLGPLVDEHGRDAVAIYVGNPNAHSLAGLLYLRPLIKALGTSNVFSASTVDQRPKEVSSALIPMTRVRRPASLHPAASPACVPPDDDEWTMTSGGSTCVSNSPTARTNAAAPSGVDAPIGITYGRKPCARSSAAAASIAAARRVRSATYRTSAPSSASSSAFAVGRSGGVPFAISTHLMPSFAAAAAVTLAWFD